MVAQLGHFWRQGLKPRNAFVERRALCAVVENPPHHRHKQRHDHPDCDFQSVLVLVRDPVLQRTSDAPAVAPRPFFFLEDRVYLRASLVIEGVTYGRISKYRPDEIDDVFTVV
jgi:hypothetical protein